MFTSRELQRRCASIFHQGGLGTSVLYVRARTHSCIFWRTQPCISTTATVKSCWAWTTDQYLSSSTTYPTRPTSHRRSACRTREEHPAGLCEGAARRHRAWCQRPLRKRRAATRSGASGKGDCETDGNVRFMPTFPAACSTCDILLASGCTSAGSGRSPSHHAQAFFFFFFGVAMY